MTWQLTHLPRKFTFKVVHCTIPRSVTLQRILCNREVADCSSLQLRYTAAYAYLELFEKSYIYLIT